MSLKEVFCQDKALSILQAAYAAGKSAHAYIFAGPEGVGKFKTAREWAKMLLCESPPGQNDFADSCGSCRSCRLFEAGSHPDFEHVRKELLEYTREGKGKAPPVELPVDVIREFLIEKVATKPTLSGRKVFVVSEAEKLNASSQNALLKVLEEPPDYCSLFLLCTRLENLLPTIKSRCQAVRFGPIAEEKITARLQETGIDQEQALYWARLSDGSLGQACQWVAVELAKQELYQTSKRLVSALPACEYADVLDIASWLVGESKKIAAAWEDLEKETSKSDISRKAQKTLVRIFISALHDAMMLNLGHKETLTNFDRQHQVKSLADRFDTEQLAERITLCYRALRQIEASVNEKLIFEQLLLSLVDSGILQV